MALLTATLLCVMGTEGAYPPYNFINDAGEVDGFERELGDELCKRAELTCEWVTNEWDSIIPNLVSGNYDAIIAACPSRTNAMKSLISHRTTPTRSVLILGHAAMLTCRRRDRSTTGTIQASLIAHQARRWLNSQHQKKPSQL